MITPVARLAIEITVAAFVLGEVMQGLRIRPGATRTNPAAELWFRAMFVGAILLIPLGRAVVPGATSDGVWLVCVGLTVAWLGLTLRWWSFVTLGAYFTVVLKTSKDQPVIDRGPYRVLRHPSYTGLLLALGGCGLALGNAVGAAGAVALVVVALVYRIRIEERALEAELGSAYREFAATRARLVPFVW